MVGGAADGDEGRDNPKWWGAMAMGDKWWGRGEEGAEPVAANCPLDGWEGGTPERMPLAASTAEKGHFYRNGATDKL